MSAFMSLWVAEGLWEHIVIYLQSPTVYDMYRHEIGTNSLGLQLYVENSHFVCIYGTH